MTDLTQLSAAQLASLIRTREISPVEIAKALLSRIEQLNPSLNALVTLSPLLPEESEQAEAAAMHGDALGPLHGVPFTVKDTIDTTGLRTTSGSALRADNVPAEDAPAVARLKAAGAILLAKTNAAGLAMDYTADNPVFGRTNNPHDFSRTPGGSSGGDAAALATCLTPLGLGSDLAGSIRIPAHFCGVVGFKPATISVPGAGQFPPSAGPYSLGSAIGPLARTVDDAWLAFGVLSKTSDAKPRDTDWSRVRVAWYSNDGVSPVTAETRAAVRSAADALQQAGASVHEERPPAVEKALDVWLRLFSRASVVLLRQVYAGNEDKAGSFVRWRLATADDKPVESLDEFIRGWLDRDRLRWQLLDWMKTTPLLIAPVGAVPALEHDALKAVVNGESISAFRAFSYAQAFNAFDLPAIAVPAGRSPEGLPIGVQV